MAGFDAQQLAAWFAEAHETGNRVGALPDDIAPRDLDDAAEVAAATLDALAIIPCGLRLMRRGALPAIAGPVTEARLLPDRRDIALGALRHPLVSAAAIGVLAEPLDPDAAAPPVLARIHPALDVSATRFGEAPEDPVLLTADLARLGWIVSGKGKPVPPGRLRVALGPKGSRARGAEVDLAEAFAEAARIARDWGGLPAGALLVVAGLTPPAAAEGVLRMNLSGIGAVEATFV